MRSYSVDAKTTGLLRDEVLRPSAGLVGSRSVGILVFMLLHIPLATLVRDNPDLATAHALSTFAVGLYFLFKDKQAYRLVCVTAYLAGAEGLWRMTGANIFWEFGKYAIGLLLLLAILKQGRLRKTKKMAWAYFVLLLPSVLLVLDDREQISFNMSGPFLLAVAVAYFSTVRFSMEQIRTILLAIIPPLIGMAYLALDSTLAYKGVVASYSKILSGGYGQNQMSAVLGLGMLATMLYAATGRRQRWFRLTIGACAAG